jgi:hypothetical protein
MSVLQNDNYPKNAARRLNSGLLRDGMLDCYATVRLYQVAFNLDEAKPTGKSYLPVVGVPGFPGFVLRPSASTGVHDRLS